MNTFSMPAARSAVCEMIPCSEPSLMSEPVSVLLLTLAPVTALFLMCEVATLFFASRTAAYEVPPSATIRAMNATAIDGDGRMRAQVLLDMHNLLVSRAPSGPGLFRVQPYVSSNPEAGQ